MRLQIKAFTLVETLLTLMIVSFIYLGLSGSIKTSFQQVEEKVFFAEFEHLYQESQKIALAMQTELDVEVTARKKRLIRRWRFLILSFCKILKLFV